MNSNLFQLFHDILFNLSFSSLSDTEEINAYVKEMTKEITAEIKSEIREVINQIENSENVDMHSVMAHISRYERL